MGTVDFQPMSPADQVVLHRMRVYLQCLGLPEAHAQQLAMSAHHDHRQAALASKSQSPANANPLDDLINDVETWLSYWCQRQTGLRPFCPELLALRLRPVLAQSPDVFLARGEARGGLEQAIIACGRLPVPEEAPLVMPTQPLGELPSVFTFAFWRAIAAKCRFAGHHVFRKVSKMR